MGFAEHGQQGMVAGAAVFARVVAFQRSLLLAVTLEDRRIQIQRVAVRAERQTFHLPLPERFVKSLDVTHAGTLETGCGWCRRWGTDRCPTRHAAPGRPQQGRVSEAFGAHQHGDQKGQESVVGSIWLGDSSGSACAAGAARPDRSSEERHENGHPAKGGDRPFGLTQDQPLAGQQSGDFPRNRIVRGVAPPLCCLKCLRRKLTPRFGFQV